MSGQPAAKVGREGGGGLVAAGGVFLQALERDRFQIERDSGIQLPQWDRLAFQHLQQRVRGIGRLEGRAASQQAVQHRPQRVHIRSGTDLSQLARGLFGRPVVGSPQDLAGRRQVATALDSLGQSEVGDFWEEDRGQRSEDRGQRTGDRGQRTEDRGGGAGCCF